MSKPKTQELGISGPGVAPVSIKQVDDAAENFIKCRDRVDSWRERKRIAEEELLKHIQEHAEEIGMHDGTCIYRYDDMEIVVKPGKTKVEIRPAAEGEDEE